MTSDMFNFQDFDPEEAAALLFTNAIESDELESPYVKAELDGDEPFPSDHNMYKIEDPNQMEDPNKVEDPNQNEMVVSSNRINLDETFSNDSFSSNGSCASLITCFKIETRHRGRPTKSPEEKFDYFNMHGIKGYIIILFLFKFVSCVKTFNPSFEKCHFFPSLEKCQR